MRGSTLFLFLALSVLLSACGGRPSASWPEMSLAGDTLYVAAGSHVYALEASTGKAVEGWTFPNPDDKEQSASLFYAAPAVMDDVLFIGSSSATGTSNGRIYAVDANTGAERWRFVNGTQQSGGRSRQFYSAPVVAEGVVYASSTDYKLYALDAATGQKRWDFSTDNWLWASPLVTTDRIYVGSMDHNVYCLGTDARLKWKFTAEGAIPSQPALAEGILYFGSFDSKVYAVDATTGQKQWEFKTGNWVWGSPVVESGIVYASSLDHKVYALDAVTGEPLPNFTPFVTGGGVLASPVLSGDSLYIASEDGQLYAVDAATGQQKWVFPTAEELQAQDFTELGELYVTPVVSDGLVYITTLDGRVFALETDTGQQRWLYAPSQ